MTRPAIYARYRSVISYNRQRVERDPVIRKWAARPNSRDDTRFRARHRWRNDMARQLRRQRYGRRTRPLEMRGASRVLHVHEQPDG